MASVGSVLGGAGAGGVAGGLGASVAGGVSVGAALASGDSLLGLAGVAGVARGVWDSEAGVVAGLAGGDFLAVDGGGAVGVGSGFFSVAGAEPAVSSAGFAGAEA